MITVMTFNRDTASLAQRMGITAPCSPLLMRVATLARRAGMDSPQDWLLAVANARGYRIVTPVASMRAGSPLEAEGLISNEELAVVLLHPMLPDRPQLLRLPAQIISRGVNVPQLLRISRMEGTNRLLLALARLALRVDAGHAEWGAIAVGLEGVSPLRVPLLHWTRLAEPVPSARMVAEGWKLVA